MIVSGDYADQVNAASANYSSTVTDPKAALITTYDYDEGAVSMLIFESHSSAFTAPCSLFRERSS